MRSCVVFAAKWPGNHALRVRLPDVAQKVALLLPCSKDGRSGYRVGIDSSDSTKVSIRPVTFGTIGTAETTTASDTPPSATASVAHGVAAGTPMLLEVRFVNGALEVRVNDGDPLIIWQGAGVGAYGAYMHFGFESAVSGAVVQKAELLTLVATEPDAQTEAWIGVCDGNVLISLDGATVQTIGQAAFPPGVPVAMRPYQGKVYAIGGGSARTIDPVLLSVLPWGGITSLTALPGATESSPGVFVAGTTRMTMIENDGDRLALAGDPQDPQNLWESALGDADDFDVTALDRPGRAFATSADFPGRIGEPIKGLLRASNGAMVIGCKTTIWVKMGDPALGVPSITPASLGTGVTGKDAMTLAAGGIALMHTTSGLMMLPVGGAPVPLSQLVLTEGIQLPRGDEDLYRVIVLRDTQRHRTMVYLTLLAGGTSLHFAYDERVGQVQPTAGGFFPDVLPESMGPMSACVYRGELLIGTRDGRVLFVDDDATTDDGATIVAKMTVDLLDEPDTSHETILTNMALTPGLASGPIEYTAYGGRTPEEAYQGPYRRLLHAGTCRGIQDAGRPIKRSVRAAAIVVELTAPAGGRIEVERLEVATHPGRILSRKIRNPIPVPAMVCAPPVVATDGGADGGPGPGSPAIEYLLDAQYNEAVIEQNQSGDAMVMHAAPDGGGTALGAHSHWTGEGVVVPF